MTKMKIAICIGAVCIGVAAVGSLFVNTYTVAPGYGPDEMREAFYKDNETCVGLSIAIPNPIQDAAPRAVCVGLLK